MADATVNRDGEHQTFAVIGHYDMTVEYDELGTHMRTQSTTKLHQAKLIWDGKAYQLITIEGQLS